MSSRTGHGHDLAELATSLDAAVHAGSEYLDPNAVQQARMAMERGLQRLELGAQHTVVALVGATGSGKSSLFNALAEMEIAEAGARRPLTKYPMACIWGEPGSADLLDWLGVPENRRLQRESVLDADRQAALHGLILLDLPDHDSTEVSHRVEVDRLIGKVDLMVWVVDPQKYADDALHTRYLQKLVDHEGVMLVVLNQIDRLGPEDLATCVRDLRRLLDADGLHTVPMLALSATRRDGVEELRDVIAGTVRSRTAVIDRSAADLATITHDLRRGVADAEPGVHGEIPGADALVNELADAAGVPAVLDAMTAEYRRRGWYYTNWPVLQWIRRMSPDAIGRLGARIGQDDLRVLLGSMQPVSAPAQRAQVRLAADAVAGECAAGLPPRWAAGIRAAVDRPETDLLHALDAAVATVDLDLARPFSWRLIWLVQRLLALVAVVGGIWVFAVGAVQLAGRYLPEPPEFAGLPLPVVMLIAGLVLGAGLALVSSVLISRSAARRHERSETRIREVVARVAHDMLIAPIEKVLGQHRTVRRALDGELTAAELGRAAPRAPSAEGAPVDPTRVAPVGPVAELDDDRVVAEHEDQPADDVADRVDDDVAAVVGDVDDERDVVGDVDDERVAVEDDEIPLAPHSIEPADLEPVPDDSEGEAGPSRVAV